MRRYRYVDLLRGLAALAVLICHYRWFFARSVGDWRTDVPLPAYSILWPIYDHGGVAVPLFWVLSGFVFAVAYGRFGKGISIRVFWLKRFSRLYPLHFVTLLVVAALQAFSLATLGTWQVYGNNDLPHFALHLFFASNWLTMTSSFNGPIWSVSIEELIYFAFLIYLKRCGLSLRVAAALAGLSFIVAVTTQNQVALCGALFFAGVAIARIDFDMLFMGAAGLVVTAILAPITPGDFAFIYAGAPALLMLAIGLDRRKTAFPARLEWFGLSTYSIYLWHMPVLIAFRIAGYLPPLPLFAAFVLSLSYLSFRFFERPAQRLIREASGVDRAERLPRSGRAGGDTHPSDLPARRWR